MFIHLRARSAYSLLEGAMPVKQLVALAKKHEMPALALTDNNNLFGSLEFSMAASGEGIQPIIGGLFSFKAWMDEESRARGKQKDQLLLIAQNEQGYENLMALASKTYLNSADEQEPMLDYEDLEDKTEGVIALTAGFYGGIGRALYVNRMERGQSLILELKRLFGDRLYIELMRHGLEEEKKVERKLIDLAIEHEVPLVATNDVYFSDVDMFEAHDALLCVADGRYISEANRRRLTSKHRFKTPEEMQAMFADVPEAIENTVNIAKRCSFMSPKRNPILPSFTAYEKGLKNKSEEDVFAEQAREGLKLRLQEHVFTVEHDEKTCEEIAKPYWERLEYEIETIINMKYPGYFLIVSDFIKWSKEQEIPVGPGRGSGAGSLVAWSLLITDLDPLRYGLFFERFLNPERVSMPDFDIDFCQDRRDEVIRYVQQKYGADRVASIITFGKLQARAVLRDVGRVLQMSYGHIDKICKLVPNNPANPCTLQEAIDMEPLLREAIAEDESVKKLTEMALKLEGLYRHASTHAAGVVIADRPLEQLVALYRDPKSDMPVVQYSMKYAETAGLVKFDFLGLKTLTVLANVVKFLEKRDIEIDLLKLPEGDGPTYEMLGKGDTLGVFQLESAGMRDTLRKLKPDSMEDIIALVSLYRPGPMDNIPTYINRKHGKEKPEYPHPIIQPILEETYGVIIYQEQVMQIAQELAGYTLGGADLLRRAMGKKIREEMEAQREIFVEGAKKNQVDEVQASNIFDLIAKFASYGFNKSHAAAYALIAYQTAYLKANYPVEFLAASMSYDMHNTDKLSMFRQEADHCDIEILPPDINSSQPMFSVEDGAIRYALAALKNVGQQAMEELVAECEKNGPYKDLYDVCTRLDSGVINKRGLEYLPCQIP